MNNSPRNGAPGGKWQLATSPPEYSVMGCTNRYFDSDTAGSRSGTYDGSVKVFQSTVSSELCQLVLSVPSFATANLHYNGIPEVSAHMVPEFSINGQASSWKGTMLILQGVFRFADGILNARRGCWAGAQETLVEV
jgi:hypothetical protein